MYDLTTLDGGYYATGGGVDKYFAPVTETIKGSPGWTLIVLAVLVVLVIALFYGYIKPYKENLISGARASIGIGGSGRGDWGNPADMVIMPNYGSEGMAVEVVDSSGVRTARGLSTASANQAASVIAGQPCSMTIASDEDAYAWRVKQANAKESFGPNDNALTRSLVGL